MTLNLKLCSEVNGLQLPIACQAEHDVTSLAFLFLSLIHFASGDVHVVSKGYFAHHYPHYLLAQWLPASSQP